MNTRVLTAGMAIFLLNYAVDAQSFWSSNFMRGFKGPVYKTDADMKVKDASSGADVIITKRLVYRVMDEKDGVLKIKVLPRVVLYSDPLRVDTGTVGAELPNASKELYLARRTDLLDHHLIWQTGLAWSALILPIKFRSATDKDSVHYQKDYTTDITVGPFFGYKVAVGQSYNQFVQVGFFAGPTLLKVQSTVLDSTVATGSSLVSENVWGFSYGYGFAYELRGLQVGLIVGKDEIGGEASKSWPYDGKKWVSFAIGYNFLSNSR